MTHHVIEGMAQVKAALAAACKFGGGQKRWAEEHGISQTYVNDMLRGSKPISHEVSTMLGYERVLVFRKASK